MPTYATSWIKKTSESTIKSKEMWYSTLDGLNLLEIRKYPVPVDEIHQHLLLKQQSLVSY